MCSSILVTFALLAACQSDGPAARVGGTSTLGLAGTVTDVNLRPVAGGIVQVVSGKMLAASAVVGPSGRYGVSGLQAGTYTVRLQPPLAYSLGPSEPDEKTVKLSAGESALANVSFVVQAALFAEDFQSYTSIDQITAFCRGGASARQFWYGAGMDGNCSHADDMVLDPSGGPNGTKALEYVWPARPSPVGTTNYTIALQPRLAIPARAQSSSELWVRFTDRLSPGFRIGGAGCRGSSCEYKYFFIDLMNGGTGVGKLRLELDSQQGGAPNDLVQLRFKIDDPQRGLTAFTDGTPGAGSAGLDVPLPVDFFGSWNTWVLGVTGIGTSQVTWSIYRNGVLLKTLIGAWFPNRPLVTTARLTIELGANINSGPDRPQSRWWRELALYTSRPSILPLVTP